MKSKTATNKKIKRKYFLAGLISKMKMRAKNLLSCNATLTSNEPPQKNSPLVPDR